MQGEDQPGSSAARTDSGGMSGRGGMVPDAVLCDTQEAQGAALPPATPTSCAPVYEAAVGLSWQQQQGLSRHSWRERDLGRQSWQEQDHSRHSGQEQDHSRRSRQEQDHSRQREQEMPIASGTESAPCRPHSSSGQGAPAVRWVALLSQSADCCTAAQQAGIDSACCRPGVLCKQHAQTKKEQPGASAFL